MFHTFFEAESTSEYCLHVSFTSAYVCNKIIISIVLFFAFQGSAHVCPMYYIIYLGLARKKIERSSYGIKVYHIIN